MKKKELRFKVDGRQACLLEDKEKRVKAVKRATSFTKPGARFSPAVKEGRWDGRTNMMKNNIVAVGLIRAKEVRDELENKGYTIKVTKWKNRPEAIPSKGFTETDEKYQYQNVCVQRMLNAIKFGGGLVLSATGSGKTKIAAQFASWIKNPCLFIVDQIDLLYQNAKEIEDWLKEPVGIVGNSKFLPSDKLTVATIQTLHKHRKNKLFRRWLKSIDIIIIDEIHVQMSRRNFSIVDVIKPRAVFGLTATLQLRRKDVRLRAFAICGPVLHQFSVKEGMEIKVLSKGIAVQVEMPGRIAELPKLPKETPMKIRMKLQSEHYDMAVSKNHEANKSIVNFIRYAIKQGYYCVVLVERLKHLHKLEEMFQRKGMEPSLCYGAVGTKDRQGIRKKFEKGKENLIIANVVFKKGINLKRVDLIFDCAQRSNKNDVLQKFGRGVRLHSAKRGLLYFDAKTLAAMLKPAKKRASALRAAKIPVIQAQYTNAKELLKLGEKVLTKMLGDK